MSYNDRFSGIARLYGIEAVNAFRTCRVSVIGIGGVGSWIAEALARTGFEHITLIDMDDICVTNTNRQIHTQVHTVGELKVEAMANRLRAINPEIQVTPMMDFLTKDNLDTLLADCDYVIDANIGAEANPGGAGIWELPGLGQSAPMFGGRHPAS